MSFLNEPTQREISSYSDDISLKGTATLMVTMFYQKWLYEPRILLQVSSESVEKWRSYGHSKNSKWPIFSRHFEYLISFQIFSTSEFLVISTYAALYIRKMFY